MLPYKTQSTSYLGPLASLVFWCLLWTKHCLMQAKELLSFRVHMAFLTKAWQFKTLETILHTSNAVISLRSWQNYPESQKQEIYDYLESLSSDVCCEWSSALWWLQSCWLFEHTCRSSPDSRLTIQEPQTKSLKWNTADLWRSSHNSPKAQS